MITNEILRSTKYVVDNSKYVKINDSKIAEFSENFEINNCNHWLKSAPFDINKFNINEKINFLLIMHSIGFCYWGSPKWTIEHKGQNYDGSFGLIVAIVKAIENGYSMLDYDYLSNIQEEDLKDILRGNIQIPLFQERLSIIRETGNIVTSSFKGDFINAIKEIDSDIDLLNVIINNFPSFNDKWTYKNKEVLFYKRAQLLVSDIFQIMGNHNYVNKEITCLTGFADYKVPQNLREKGLIDYNEDLANKIDNKVYIEKGSEEEIEIRSNTIWAIEKIKEIVKNRFENVNSVTINDQLWLSSQTGINKPYHLTRTTSY